MRLIQTTLCMITWIDQHNKRLRLIFIQDIQETSHTLLLLYRYIIQHVQEQQQEEKKSWCRRTITIHTH